MARRGENVRKRKDGRWEGRYVCIVDGKRQVKSVYAKSYLDVKTKLTEAKSISKQYERTTITLSSKCTFGNTARLWLQYIHDNRKPATYAKYYATYEKHLTALSEEPISLITNSLLEEKIFTKQHIESESLKKSIIMITNQIIKCFNEAHHESMDLLITQSVAKKKAIEILSRSEQKKLIDYLQDETDPYKQGILICLSTGMRLGEICALKWSDIDLDNGIIKINSTVQRLPVKGEKTKTILFEGPPKSECSLREIPVPNEVIALLNVIPNEGAYLIAGANPVEPRTYEKKLNSYLKKANIKEKNFHALRHTFATNCIECGMDVKSLSEILGHADVHTTLNKYVHPTTEAKRTQMKQLLSFYGTSMGQTSFEAI